MHFQLWVATQSDTQPATYEKRFARGPGRRPPAGGHSQKRRSASSGRHLGLLFELLELSILSGSCLILSSLGCHSTLIVLDQIVANVRRRLVPDEVGRVVLPHDAVQNGAALRLALVGEGGLPVGHHLADDRLHLKIVRLRARPLEAHVLDDACLALLARAAAGARRLALHAAPVDARVAVGEVVGGRVGLEQQRLELQHVAGGAVCLLLALLALGQPDVQPLLRHRLAQPGARPLAQLPPLRLRVRAPSHPVGGVVEVAEDDARARVVSARARQLVVPAADGEEPLRSRARHRAAAQSLA
mmetsp:Transcript_3252/g.10307  ORF Transcript_3252/g.10307 Transcript_3252/m.10307 type:complete len:301 (-) Transcript_3252:741-1643(-)